MNDPEATCPSCGWTPQHIDGCLNYLSRRDRESAETQQYIETYDVLAERNIAKPVELDSYVESLSERLISRLGDLRGKKLCDVGSGRGFLIKHAIQKGASEVTAVDITERSLRIVARTYGVRAFLANAENLPFFRAFDVITATDILEHVLNTSNFLVTANWALQDGGVLAVRVPYLEDMLPYSNFHGLPMHYTHVRTFDRKLLVHTLQEAGFKVRSVFYDGFNPEYMRKWLKRAPWLNDAIRRQIIARYNYDATAMNPFLARLLMKPIEVGAIAIKIRHEEPRHYHKDLAEFYDRRRHSTRN